jgi:hypothetical protein
MFENCLNCQWKLFYDISLPEIIYVDFYRHENALHLSICQGLANGEISINPDKKIDFWIKTGAQMYRQLLL